MAASLEGETQQPAFKLDSLTVPQPSSHPSSQTSNLDYADLDRSLPHRSFMPPTSSPAPESADPEHNFLPGQIRHAESARTEDLGYASLGESTALEGQQAVAEGNMLRTGSGTRGPPLRKTGSGSIFPTWATQRQQPTSSRATSPVHSGPSRHSSRALNRVLQQDEEDQLDSSSPASAPPIEPEDDHESTPNVPTPPASTPHAHRPSRPVTPAKQSDNASYKPVSAHKPPSLAVPPVAGPSNYASRGSRSPNKAPLTSTAPQRTGTRRTATAPPPDETQESFFGMDMGMKGRQMLDRLDRERGSWKRTNSAPIKRGAPVRPPQQDEGNEAEGEPEDQGGDAVDVEAVRDTAKPGTEETPSPSSPVVDPAPYLLQAVVPGPESQGSGTSPTPQLRRATARKVIPDSSDNEQDGEQDQSILFTQRTEKSEHAGPSGPIVLTASQKEAINNRNILDDVSVSDMGGIPTEMQLPSDTYSSQTSQPPQAEEGNRSQSLQQQGQPSSMPAGPTSSPVLPQVQRNPRRFGQFEETMTSLPPQLRRFPRHDGMGSPPGSFDAMPGRNEIFSSQGGSIEFTQRSSRSEMDLSFQATQYVATDALRGVTADRVGTDAQENMRPEDTNGQIKPRRGEPQSQPHMQSQTQVNGPAGSDGKSQSLQSNGSSNASHASSGSGQHQTQTQIATEDSQRRAQEAAIARQKEREASLERRKAADTAVNMRAGSNSKKDQKTSETAHTEPARPTDQSDQSRSPGKSHHIPRVQPHRLLRRTGSHAMASAPFTMMTEAARPAKHTGLSESLSESNVGQVKADAVSSLTSVRLGTEARQPDGAPEEGSESHDSSNHSGSALFTLPTETLPNGDGVQPESQRHRRMRSLSSNGPEPTSSMQADDPIPLGIPTQTQTQRSDAGSISPKNGDASQLSDKSQPVKKAGTRRGRRLAQIEEVSSPPAGDADIRAERNMSSPPRSDPPTPPADHGVDKDTDMDGVDGNDVSGDASDDGQHEETLASHRSTSSRSARASRSMAQTLEPTLLNAETARTLVPQPRMATPTRTYGARAADNAPVKQASPHVKPNRMLKRNKRGGDSVDCGSDANVNKVQIDAEANDASDAGEVEGAVEAGGDDPADETSARRAGSGKGIVKRKARRVLSPSPIDNEDIEMDGAASAEGTAEVNAEYDGGDAGHGVEAEHDEEDESPESPPTPEDPMDGSFRPPVNKGKGRAAPAVVLNKRKRRSSPSVSPSPVVGRRSRKKPRKFTPNGDSPAKSTRAATTSRDQSPDPLEGDVTSDDEPESPPTPIDTTDYSFVPTAVRKAIKKRPSEVTSVASTSSGKRAKSNPKAAPPAMKRGKGRAADRATPGLPPATRSQSVSASRATAEPTPSVADEAGEEEDAAEEEESEDEDVDINGPGVFGKYRDSYYAGRIIKRVGTSFQIEFADEDTDDLVIGNIRQGVLRAGDKVKSNVRGEPQKAIYIVKHDWSYPSIYLEAERDTPIAVTHEKTGVERSIPLRYLHIAYRTVLSSWEDRHVDEADFTHLPWSDGARDRSGGAAVARPVQKTASKVVQGTNAFAGQAFMITPRGEDTKKYEALIIRHGGTVCEWQDLFIDASSPNGAGSSASKITFGGGLKTAQTPYLITTSSIGGEFEEPKKGEQQGKMKAKIMCALAFGIPCLAPAYIEEALRDPNHDIRGFLLVPGKSLKHGSPTSQVVDAAWGRAGWDVKQARHELRPLRGKKVLFAGSKSQDLLGIVTACLTGLGAAELKVIDGYAGEPYKDYDVVLVAEKSKKSGVLPKELMRAPNGCDVQWLKQVCISGEWLPPTLYSWS